MDEPETSSKVENKLQTNNQQQSTQNRREFHSKTHSFNKRPVSKPIHRKCDIYVSNKSNIKVCIDMI